MQRNADTRDPSLGKKRLEPTSQKVAEGGCDLDRVVRAPESNEDTMEISYVQSIRQARNRTEQAEQLRKRAEIDKQM